MLWAQSTTKGYIRANSQQLKHPSAQIAQKPLCSSYCKVTNYPVIPILTESLNSAQTDKLLLAGHFHRHENNPDCKRSGIPNTQICTEPHIKHAAASPSNADDTDLLEHTCYPIIHLPQTNDSASLSCCCWHFRCETDFLAEGPVREKLGCADDQGCALWMPLKEAGRYRWHYGDSSGARVQTRTQTVTHACRHARTQRCVYYK